MEKDAARGDVVCMGCGCVLEEDLIVSELTFQEQSSGALALVGQFVSTECMLQFIRNTGSAIIVLKFSAKNIIKISKFVSPRDH